MKIIIAALLLTLQSGCVLATLGAFQTNKEMTKEQIEAFRAANMDVFGCITVTGPPPTGGTTWIIVPKNSNPDIGFLPGCALRYPSK